MKKLLMLVAVFGLVAMSSTPVSANENEVEITTYQHIWSLDKEDENGVCTYSQHIWSLDKGYGNGIATYSQHIW